MFRVNREKDNLLMLIQKTNNMFSQQRKRQPAHANTKNFIICSEIKSTEKKTTCSC